MTPSEIIERAFRVQGKGFKLRAEDAIKALEAAGYRIVKVEPHGD